MYHRVGNKCGLVDEDVSLELLWILHFEKEVEHASIMRGSGTV